LIGPVTSRYDLKRGGRIPVGYPAAPRIVSPGANAGLAIVG
jgi:hypothetical protein